MRGYKKELKNFPFTNAGFSCRIGAENNEREGNVISDLILRLPEEESIVLSGPAVQRLLQGGSGDAALLYIAALKNRGCGSEKLRAQLRWDQERFQRASAALAQMGLVSLPAGAEKTPPPPVEERRNEYTRADVVRSLEEDRAFAGLTSAVEGTLGKKLNTPDLMILLGLYDQLGLPADVIFLLVNFCAERISQRHGAGRRPAMRQIEQEGYLWARLGLMDQESAAAYIKKYQQSRTALPRLMRLLGLGDRLPAPSEEKYLLAWIEMDFEDEAILLAYDRTVVKCGQLKWAYMNRILCSWHEKGLHTVAQVEAGDRPGRRQNGPIARESADTVLEDMARMAKYYQQLGQEKEEK